MAQFIFTNNTYAGEALAGYMSRSLLEADSVKRGLITPIPNVKARKVILLVDDEVVFQDPSARFVDQNTTAAQTERYLDPVTYEFSKEQEWEALTQSWEVEQLKPGAMEDYNGIVELSDYLVGRYLDKIQIANERLYWLGKGNTTEAKFTAPYPGLLSKIATDPLTKKIPLSNVAGSTMNVTGISIDANGQATATVADTTLLQNGDVVTVTGTFGNTLVDSLYGAPSTANPQSYQIQVVSGTTFILVQNFNESVTRSRPATFTGTVTISGGVAAKISYINQSNVLQVLGAVFANVSEIVRNKPDFNLLVSYNITRAYALAQANKATNVLNAFVDKKVLDFLGDKLQVMEHWNGNTILAGRASNIFLGVDLMSDTSRLITVNLAPNTADQVVRMRARMKSDTNYAFANELLYVSA